MSKMSDGCSEPAWRRSLRVGAVVVGLIAIAAGPFLLFYLPNPHVGWAAMIAGLIFMVSSRFDEVVEIGFGSFKTRLERRVRDVEDAMEAVRHLAKASARNALNSVQYAGRIQPFTESDKLDFLSRTRRLLSDLGIHPQEVREAEHDWHRAIEFDYADWALGGDQLPEDLPEGMHERWKELRKGGIEQRPTAEEVRSFLREAGMLTSEREEILRDYEHYVATREHRRKEKWLHRHDRQ